MHINDARLFEQLFREHYPTLCAYAVRHGVDKQVAEDIVQNFFISIWEKKNLSVTSDNFLPYSFRAIQNSCINYYKSEILKESFLVSLAEEWREQLEEEEFIYQNEIRSALLKLPEKCRVVFLLKCVKGFKYKEIAEVTGISVNTVKYHLGEGFRIMREELKELAWMLIALGYLN